MRYEMLTLTVRLGGAGAVLAGVKADSERSITAAKLVGCWTSEIGELNRIFVLRSFADDAAMQAERWKLTGDVNPFSAGEAIQEMVFDSYAPFPWAAPPQPGPYGAVYEIRTYKLKHGGLPATIAAWEAAMPGREEFSPLSLAMYALEGAPRFTHIWPFASLDARAKARADSVAAGAWPPKNGPAWLTGDMRSTVALPAPFSPLA